MNKGQLLEKKHLIDPIDQLITYKKKNPSINEVYNENYLKMLRSLKNLFMNYIIKQEGYYHISILSILSIVQRMAYNLPLYPIHDLPEEWSDVIDDCEEYTMYRAKRYMSLVKIVSKISGEISYRDQDRFEGTYRKQPSVTFHCGLIDNVVGPLYPIETLPYYPDKEKIRVYTEDFLVNPIHGDCDTMAIFYAEDQIFGNNKKINRFFKESENNGKWKEISRLEYYLRRLIRVNPDSKRSKRIRSKHYSLMSKKLNIPNTSEEGCAPNDGPACEASCKECTNCIREPEEVKDGSENTSMS